MKMPKKNLRMLGFLLAMLLIFTGCSSYEPNEFSFVQIIGIDEGQANLLDVSFLIAIPKNFTSKNGSSQDKGAFLVTVSAPTVFQALKLANTFVGRRLSLTHAKGIIFSDKLAKKGLLVDILPSLLRFRETRGTAFIGITEDPVDKLLEEFVPLLEVSPSRYMELLTENYTFTSYTSGTQLIDVYTDLKILGSDSVITLLNLSPEKLDVGKKDGQHYIGGSYKAGELPKKGGVKIEALGAAVLRDGKMVATLTGTETMIYNMIKGDFRSSFVVVPATRQEGAPLVNIEVFYARKPKIKVNLTEQGLIIDLVLRLEGNVLEGGATSDYALRQKRAVLEEEVAKQIKEEVEKLIDKSQSLSSDFLGFGLYARRLAKTVEEWDNLDWDVLYETAQVNVTVDFKVRRTST